MLLYASLALNIVFVIAAGWASARHFNRGNKNEQEPRGATALTLATIAGTLLNVWFTLDEPRAPSTLTLTSLALTSLAAWIFWRAVAATRQRGLGLAFGDRTPDAVVSDGIYSLIRHPFYTSYLLYWASWIALTNLDIFPIAFALAMLVFYIFAIRKEEHLLSERLGAPYQDLMRNSSRIIPWIY